MRRSTRAIPAFCLAFLTSSPLAAQDEGARPLLSTPPADGSTGATVFATGCAECHAGDESSRAPGLVALSGMSPNAIVRTLETGRMRRHGAELTRDERVAVAEWISGRALVEEALPASAYCAEAPLGPGEVHWSGWGGGRGESGFRDAASAGLTAADLGDLELAWAFGFPQASEVRSKPAVVGDRVIVGSANGSLYALDLETGCVRWTFEADASIRGAITIGEAAGTQAALFADFRTNVYAVDAASGALLWRARAGEHPDHTNTGSVAYHDGKLFVPISSMEIASAMDPSYECCTSSGGVVAFDAAEGEP
ncbi:MAG: PQQ-binding-like beta-propeller repeat protein, partial [Gemmatimonadota bacterium]|nr:PQQ-binding-like beta-propeller repeat protein [Gemmatimonadota bacterium]